MQVCTAPEELIYGRSVFLAGGISDCHDWQVEMIAMLEKRGFQGNVINPRRANFDVSQVGIAEEQIRWEHKALKSSTAILFWFPPETLCPITLYELGAHSQRNVPLFIGVHPEYKRKLDVEVQTKLCRPHERIYYSLEELADAVSGWDRIHQTMAEMPPSPFRSGLRLPRC